METMNDKIKFHKISSHKKAWIRIRIDFKSWIRNRIRMDFKSWIRIRIDFKSWIRIKIRICIETNTDPKHWSKVGIDLGYFN